MKLLDMLNNHDEQDTPMKAISVRLDVEMLERLDALVSLAKSSGLQMSRSFVVRDALDGYVTAFEEQYREEIG